MDHDLAARAVQTPQRKVNSANNHRQHIVEVVGNTTGQLSNGFHLLNLTKLRFGGLTFKGFSFQGLVGFPQFLGSLAHCKLERFGALGLGIGLSARLRVLAKRLNRDHSQKDRAQSRENSEPAQIIS